MSASEVVVSGYTSMDRIIRVKTPLRAGFTSLVSNRDNAEPHFGGCSVNIAYGMARLGHATAPCIRVGDDSEGEQMVAFLREAGASADGISVICSEKTPNCYLLEDDEGNHVTVYYTGAMDANYASSLPSTLFEGARLGVMTVGALPDNVEFLDCCKRNGVPLAFGMKADLDAFPQAFLEEVLDYASVIFLNHSERETIQKSLKLGSITDLFRSGNLVHLVVTDGRKGSHCHEKTDTGLIRTTVPIVESHSFVTAIGAGDAYMAGFLSGYLEGEPATVCAQMGSTLASFAVEAAGACEGIPTRKQFTLRLESSRRKEI